MTPWKIVEVLPKPNYTLHIRFADGLEGDVRFLESFFREVFAPLKDEAFFNQAYIEHGAVTWPGEVDFCPDYMHKVISLSPQHRWVLD